MTKTITIDQFLAAHAKRGAGRKAGKNYARKPKTRAGSRPRGTMNQTEAAFDQYLQRLRSEGKVVRWWFEAFQLALSFNPLSTYTPDFMVELPDGELVLFDVKISYVKKKDGKEVVNYEGDSRKSIITIAGLYPQWTMTVAAKRPKTVGGGWLFEEISK